MDYAKFVRKDMPLAVPTQKRPPDKYASHPYPVLVDEGMYQPIVSPLDFTLLVLLHRYYMHDIFISTTKPLDFLLKPTLLEVSIDDNEVYQPSTKPTDFTLKPVLIGADINGDYHMAIVSPLSFSLKSVVVRYYHPDDDGYQPMVKPLNITLEKT